jgi:LysR family hca operon transcriptional activator
MGILREQLPSTEIVIHSQQSPELAAGLMRGKIDVAFMRPERKAPGLTFELLRKEPLIVLMPRDHALAAHETIRPQDIAGEILIGVPTSNAPELRAVTDRYAAQVGIDLTPTHEVDNLSMAISLVASTGGVSLLPLYARNFLPPTVVSRRLQGVTPMIDLSLGYNQANTARTLKLLLSKIEDLKFRAFRSGDRDL